MKVPRVTLKIVLEQENPEEERDFGTAQGWASCVKDILDRRLSCANVIEVKPMRNS